MLADHRQQVEQQVIAALANKAGVMLEAWTPVNMYESVCTESEVREAIAAMQAKLEVMSQSR